MQWSVGMATPVDRGGGERETVVWPGGAAEAAAVAGLVLIPSLRHSQGCDTAAAVNITPGQHTSSHHCTGHKQSLCRMVEAVITNFEIPDHDEEELEPLDR